MAVPELVALEAAVAEAEVSAADSVADLEEVAVEDMEEVAATEEVVVDVAEEAEVPEAVVVTPKLQHMLQPQLEVTANSF